MEKETNNQIESISSEELFRTIVESSHEIIIQVDKQGNFLFINKTAEDLTGFKIADFIGKGFTSVVHPDDLQIAFKILSDSFSGKQSNYEIRIFNAKGEIIYLELNTSPINNNGIVSSAVGFCRDITKQKQAEEKLRLSEITYRGLLNTVTEALYAQDEEMKFVDVNKTSELLYGYEREYFVGKTPEFLSAPGKNDMEKITALFQEAFNGKPQMFEFWGIKKDGTVFPKDVSITAGTYFGKKVVIAVSRDITGRKKIETELIESKERYKAMIENIDQLVIEFDENGTYLNIWAEDESLLAVPKEKVIGKTVLEILGHKFAKPFLEKIQHVISSGKPEIYEYQLDVIGGPRWFTGRVNPIFTAENKIKSVSFIARDITGRKKTEEEILLKNRELEKLNSEKDIFFSIIAHDLKNPFTGFLGYTDMMKNNLHTMTINEIMNISHKLNISANNLYSLLNNLLEWSLMQRGLITFSPENCNLKDIINGSIKNDIYLLNQKEISLHTDIPENLSIFIDKNMIEFALRNLFANAIKFTNRKGCISIIAKPENNNEVQICITDTGIGMNKELTDNLFKINEKVKREGTESEPSTGLGLLLCKEFIEKNNGKITVESEEGKGSKFSFTLKRNPD